MQARLDPLPRAVWIIALVALLLHLLPRPGYGFHRDELLYLAMGDHLDFLRMQFPPLIAALAQIARRIPIALLAAIHLLAALALVGIILWTAAIARMLGGGPRAQILAAMSVLVAPLFMRSGVLFQPVVFEQLWWCLAALAYVALLAGRDKSWWIILGLALGLSAMTKFSGAIFGFALVVAILLSPIRRDLRSWRPWLALGIPVLLAAPSLLGQQLWSWPFLAQARVLRDTQLDHVSPLGFVTGQLLMAGMAAPLLLAGICSLGLHTALRPFQSVLVFGIVAFVLLLALRGKDYYFGPVHPTLFAAGAVVAGPWLSSRRWAWAAAMLFLAAGGLIALPIGIPLLPPPQMITFAAKLGLGRVVTTNRGTTLALPQDYADMIGWREQAGVVAGVFHALPSAEQGRAVIVGDNYGRTGALALYGPKLGLPYPISTHGDFYQWGTGDRLGDVVIVVGGDQGELRSLCGDLVVAGRSLNPLGVEEEQNVPIFVCRQLRRPLHDLWPLLGVDWG